MLISTRKTVCAAVPPGLRGALLIFVPLWLLAAVIGHAFLAGYSAKATAGGDPPKRWPADSPLARTEGMPIAVVFLHPRCPCSSSTLSELERAMARVTANYRVLLCYFAPTAKGQVWGDTPLRRRSEALRGTSVFDDTDGKEAARFGAAVSGHVVAYSSDGSLVFAGGITPARGHEGDNLGSECLVAALSGRATAASTTPAFGCSFFVSDGDSCPLCVAGERP